MNASINSVGIAEIFSASRQILGFGGGSSMTAFTDGADAGKQLDRVDEVVRR